MLWIPIQTLRHALRVEVREDDPELARLALAAKAMIERSTGRRLSPTVDHAYAAGFARSITLPAPLVSVDEVAYLDLEGSPQTLDAAHYRVSNVHGPLPVLEFLSSVPESPLPGSVDVEITHGYAEVPADLVQVGVALVALWYANVEAAAPVVLTSVPLSAEAILDGYCIRGALR